MRQGKTNPMAVEVRYYRPGDVVLVRKPKLLSRLILRYLRWLEETSWR